MLLDSSRFGQGGSYFIELCNEFFHYRANGDRTFEAERFSGSERTEENQFEDDIIWG